MSVSRKQTSTAHADAPGPSDQPAIVIGAIIVEGWLAGFAQLGHTDHDHLVTPKEGKTTGVLDCPYGESEDAQAVCWLLGYQRGALYRRHIKTITL